MTVPCLTSRYKPSLDAVTGRYFEGTEEAAAHPQAHDERARRRLRELTRSLLDG
ncbi:MAG: hypothetical protein KY438_09975 [Actinobacteria bacterium]|nr:hypothetical protein [Actinomycetota bacterium]